MSSACRVISHISHDAIKVARAGSRGCLSTKVYKASSRGTDGSEQVHSKKSAPKEEWQGQRASCSTMGEGHQLQGPNKFLLPAEVASRIAKLSIQPWAPVCRLLCSHWYVSRQDIHRPCPEGCWLLAWRGAAFKHFPVLIHQLRRAEE